MLLENPQSQLFFPCVKSGRKSHVPLCPYRDYNAYCVRCLGFFFAFMSSGPVELKNKQEQRTADKTMRRFTLLTFYSVTQHPLPFPCPPRLPSIPPFFSLSLSYKSTRSFIRPVSAPERPSGQRKRAEGLRGEKRDRHRKGRMKGRGWRRLKPCSLIAKCNTPISMLICPVTAEMDVCDFLADVMHT